MDNSSQKPDRLDELIHQYCEGELNEASHKELEQLLLESESAARRYTHLVQVWAWLRDWANIAESQDLELSPEVSRELAKGEKQAVRAPRSSHRLKWLGGLSALAAAVAIVSAVVLPWGGEGLPANRGGAQQVAEAADPSASPANAQPAVQYVARVVEVSDDAAWGDSRPREFLLRLTGGEQIQLEAGLVKVQFLSGASVIVHGPATFEVLASDTGRLIEGRITGRAENGNFKLLTEIADVIDLGTEFGVSVDGAAGTDVCVFDGAVDVNVRGNASTGGSSEPMRLTEGMALRVGSNGRVNDAAQISRNDYQRHGEQGSARQGAEAQFSLVDIVAGGDGQHAWLAGAIDPRTGDWDTEVLLDPEVYRDRYPEQPYKQCDVSPLIDGVFIPPHEGGLSPIDSSGRALDLGKNDGKTWGPVWSRRHVPSLRSGGQATSDFWGTATLEGILKLVEESSYGVVGLHANVGVTIDLRALRMLEGRPVTNFQSQIANIDNSALRDPAYAATHEPLVDLRVFVDGELRFERKEIGRTDGRIDVDVPLKPNDRFLTLVSTDAGDTFSYDHLVLIDPELLLQARQ